MKETPESITAWASETFGEVPLIQVATRCNIEVAELVEAVLYSEESAQVAEECVDVLIMLLQIWHRVVPGVGVDGLLKHPSGGAVPLSVVIELTAKTAHLVAAGAPTTAIRLMLRDAIATVSNICASRCRIVDVSVLIDAKMEINRKRSWATVDGVLRHV